MVEDHNGQAVGGSKQQHQGRAYSVVLTMVLPDESKGAIGVGVIVGGRGGAVAAATARTTVLLPTAL